MSPTSGPATNNGATKERSFLPSHYPILTAGNGAATCVIPTATSSRSANILKSPSTGSTTTGDLEDRPRNLASSRFKVAAPSLRGFRKGGYLCCEQRRVLISFHAPASATIPVRKANFQCRKSPRCRRQKSPPLQKRKDGAASFSMALTKSKPHKGAPARPRIRDVGGYSSSAALINARFAQIVNGKAQSAGSPPAAHSR